MLAPITSTKSISPGLFPKSSSGPHLRSGVVIKGLSHALVILPPSRNFRGTLASMKIGDVTDFDSEFSERAQYQDDG